jgi:CelD/BcsL family acetyltransferase involved in cellulose biosynthesis
MGTISSVDPIDNIDLGVSPYVDLPDSWDSYLAGTLSQNTRQKARRFLKKVDERELRVTQADVCTIERDLRILLDFWSARWGERKAEKLPAIIRSMQQMLMRSFVSGHLFLPVLWKEDRPLGALACLTDPVKRVFLFYCCGRDETVTSPPPGFILHAYTIRHALSQGYRVYDFLRGNEPYKYMFGAKERHTRSICQAT